MACQCCHVDVPAVGLVPMHSLANGARILHEDNHIIVAYKPPNMLSQGDETGDSNLLNIIKGDIAVRYNKPGKAFIGLVHRLDRPVGGLMVFARTSKAAARLADQLRTRTLSRQYFAVVHGTAPPCAQLEDYLLKDGKGMVRVVHAQTPGAQIARLSFTRMAAAGGYSLLCVQLQTGRQHQIRVQLAHFGFSIVADARYGTMQKNVQIALWAGALAFVHPTSKQQLSFCLPPPECFPWNLFETIPQNVPQP